jgi:hypothetical protein
MFKANLLSAVLVSGLLAFPAMALAHSPADPSVVGDLKKLSAASSLVFHGKVKSITYRNAEVKGGGLVPYSFVTFTVTEKLKGEAPGEITLRFMGGANGRGGYTMISGVPAFSVGDEDLLFVAGNGEQGCALAQCEFGRYRVSGGAVYEAHGSAVKIGASGKVSTAGAGPMDLLRVSYPSPRFDDLLAVPGIMARIKAAGLTVDQARARYAKEAPQTLTIRTASDGDSAGRNVVKGLPLAAMKSAMAQAIGASPRKATAAFRSADINGVLVAPDMTEARPPK